MLREERSHLINEILEILVGLSEQDADALLKWLVHRLPRRAGTE